MSIDIVNEDAHNMEHYIQIIKGESQNSEAYSWRSKAFPSPSEVSLSNPLLNVSHGQFRSKPFVSVDDRSVSS